MTAASERAYMHRVKELPCGVCRAPGPSEAHHVRTGQGMSQRAGNYCTIPLCIPCHRGPNGLHGDRALWKIHKLSEMDVLDDTIGRLAA